jgi:hypothetical protein
MGFNSDFKGIKMFSCINYIYTYSSFHAPVLFGPYLAMKLDVCPQFRLKVVISTGKMLELRSCSACFTDSSQFATAAFTLPIVTGNVGIQYDLIPEPF